jgi:hypothetical protein
VVLLLSFFALALAQATVPQKLAPQGAMEMMLLPPGLRYRPWSDEAAVPCAAARARMTVIAMTRSYRQSRISENRGFLG